MSKIVFLLCPNFFTLISDGLDGFPQKEQQISDKFMSEVTSVAFCDKSK